MFGFGGEILFILFLAMLIFGPEKLPEIGRMVAKGMAEVRKASNELKRTLNAELAINEQEAEARRNALSRTPPIPPFPPATPAELAALAEPAAPAAPTELVTAAAPAAPTLPAASVETATAAEPARTFQVALGAAAATDVSVPWADRPPYPVAPPRDTVAADAPGHAGPAAAPDPAAAAPDDPAPASADPAGAGQPPA